MVPLAADTLSSFGTVANVNALRDAMGLTKADPAAGDVAESLTAEVVVAEAAATEVETTTAIATVPAEASGVDEGMPPIATTVLSHPAGVTTAVPVSAQLMAQVTQEQLAAAYAAYGMSPPPPGAALQAMEGSAEVQAAYAVFRTRVHEPSEVFNVGRYLDRVVRDPADGLLRFAEKRVVFDSENILNSVIYPI